MGALRVHVTGIREEVESVISESEALMNYALCLSACPGEKRHSDWTAITGKEQFKFRGQL